MRDGEQDSTIQHQSERTYRSHRNRREDSRHGIATYLECSMDSRVASHCNYTIIPKTNTLRHETHGTTDMLSQLSPSYIFAYLFISCTIDWAQTPYSDAVASHVRRWTGSRSTRIPANVYAVPPWQEFEQERIICTRIEHQLLIGAK
jgi:hypothetical protein